MGRKAAVVIGVNRTGGALPPLESAAKGARRVAGWLEEEGFDVACLTDERGPVNAKDVREAVARFVTVPPRYELLVVYFSGHGYWQARSDRWLLSDAPQDTGDAVNLNGAMDVARYSGIETVVFVSDACRSIPDSPAGMRVDGIDAFPNLDEIDSVSKIDFFKATSESRSAYEARISRASGGNGNEDDGRESILTTAWLSAYEAPRPDMVLEVQEDGDVLRVVPNRRLEDFLQDRVDALLDGVVDATLSQRIEANVPSGDEVYIGRARGLAIPDRDIVAGVGMGGARRPAASDPETTELAREMPVPISPVAFRGMDTADALRIREPVAAVDHFESQVGFTVRGAGVLRATCTKGGGEAWAEVLAPGGVGVPAVVRLWDVDHGVTVAIQLDDGRCAVFPALAGYIGHVTVDRVGVAGVGYVPSSNTERHDVYADRREEIDRLRSLVALSVERGALRVQSQAEAERFAQQIRMEKAVDPSLGLYAAHAYAQAGLDRDVVSVLEYMRRDLGIDLFDVRLLASRRDGLQGPPFVPFCPMLTQTWSLLRPRGVTLHPRLEEVAPYLEDSLWTTFGPQVAGAIIDAVETGELR